MKFNLYFIKALLGIGDWGLGIGDWGLGIINIKKFNLY